MSHKKGLISFTVILTALNAGCKLERIPTDELFTETKDFAAPDMAYEPDMASDEECKAGDNVGFCAFKCGIDIDTTFNRQHCNYFRHKSWLKISMTAGRDGASKNPSGASHFPMDRGCPCMLELVPDKGIPTTSPVVSAQFDYKFSYRFEVDPADPRPEDKRNYTDKDEISIFVRDQKMVNDQNAVFNYSSLTYLAGKGSFQLDASVMRGDLNKTKYLFVNFFSNFSETYIPSGCQNKQCRNEVYWQLNKFEIHDTGIDKVF